MGKGTSPKSRRGTQSEKIPGKSQAASLRRTQSEKTRRMSQPELGSTDGYGFLRIGTGGAPGNTPPICRGLRGTMTPVWLAAEVPTPHHNARPDAGQEIWGSPKPREGPCAVPFHRCALASSVFQTDGQSWAVPEDFPSASLTELTGAGNTFFCDLFPKKSCFFPFPCYFKRNFQPEHGGGKSFAVELVGTVPRKKVSRRPLPLFRRHTRLAATALQG